MCEKNWDEKSFETLRQNNQKVCGSMPIIVLCTCVKWLLLRKHSVEVVGQRIRPTISKFVNKSDLVFAFIAGLFVILVDCIREKKKTN